MSAIRTEERLNYSTLKNITAALLQTARSVLVNGQLTADQFFILILSV